MAVIADWLEQVLVSVCSPMTHWPALLVPSWNSRWCLTLMSRPLCSPWVLAFPAAKGRLAPVSCPCWTVTFMKLSGSHTNRTWECGGAWWEWLRQEKDGWKREIGEKIVKVHYLNIWNSQTKYKRSTHKTIQSLHRMLNLLKRTKYRRPGWTPSFVVPSGSGSVSPFLLCFYSFACLYVFRQGAVL